MFVRPEEIAAYYDGVKLPRVSFGRWWDSEYDTPRVIEIELDFVEATSTVQESRFNLTLFDIGLDITLDWRCN